MVAFCSGWNIDEGQLTIFFLEAFSPLLKYSPIRLGVVFLG
jgi:hypothetical protein